MLKWNWVAFVILCVGCSGTPTASSDAFSSKEYMEHYHDRLESSLRGVRATKEDVLGETTNKSVTFKADELNEYLQVFWESPEGAHTDGLSFQLLDASGKIIREWQPGALRTTNVTRGGLESVNVDKLGTYTIKAVSKQPIIMTVVKMVGSRSR